MKKSVKVLLALGIIFSLVIGCSNLDKDLSNGKQGMDKLISVSGIYLGQIDSHSIEVKVENEIKAFSFMEMGSIFENLNLSEGDKINFSFFEGENGELFIKEIEKVTNQDSELIKLMEGIYLGQIDSHSIEIKVEEIVRAYQILEVKEQFEELKLKEGDNIKFSYKEKEGNVLTITMIRK